MTKKLTGWFYGIMNYGSSSSFSKGETRLIAGMSMLMAIRMLGISMIIPVFSLIATKITGSSETLAGIAVGIFGISQTLFLVPLGRLSDRWGRKQITLIGLTVYFAGSLLSGLSDDIYQLIASRFIAGAGAVSGVTMAWLTDGIDPSRRNRALSFMGMSIGLSVIIGFTVSPIVAGLLSSSAPFYICTVMTLAAILFTVFFLSNNERSSVYDLDSPALLSGKSMRDALRSPDIIRLCAAGMASNWIVTSLFFIMPILFRQDMEIASMWKIYVPVALSGTAFMYYFGRRADSSGTVKVSLAAVAFMGAGILISILFSGFYARLASFVLIYSGHCILSPVLPAAVSSYPGGIKGGLLSLFNASQFIGSAIGGIFSGFMLKYYSGSYFSAMLILLVIPLVMMSGFKKFHAQDGAGRISSH